MPLKAPAHVVPDWAGFYFGGHVGYVVAGSDWNTTAVGAGNSPVSGSMDVFDRNGPWGPMTGGIQGGYNYVFPSHLMIGFEADISFPNHFTGSQTFSLPGNQFNISDKLELFGTTRARAGYAFGNWLIYGTGGFAFDRDLLQNTQLAGSVDQVFVTRYGWTLGLGAELLLSRNWSAKFEYEFMDFGARSVPFAVGAQQYTSNLTVQIGSGWPELPLRKRVKLPRIKCRGHARLE